MSRDLCGNYLELRETLAKVSTYGRMRFEKKNLMRHGYACIYMRTCIYMCVCMHTLFAKAHDVYEKAWHVVMLYSNVCTYTYICTYTCMYIYICTHTYIHIHEAPKHTMRTKSLYVYLYKYIY